MTTTTALDLWAEAVRLETPLSEVGRTPVDVLAAGGLELACEILTDWNWRFDIAAYALAMFAEWDVPALRACYQAHQPAIDVDWPCGCHLLHAATHFAEKPPAGRARYLAKRVQQQNGGVR